MALATVHLINPLVTAFGGAQWRTLTLFELLAEREEVYLWSEFPPSPALTSSYPIRHIVPGRFPKGGNLVFVGAYFRISNWVEFADAKRIILIFNSHLVSDLRSCLEGFARLGRKDVDVAFASQELKDMVGDIDGPIHVSPISRNRFKPQPNRSEPFTVGRMGRNDWTKHHPDDPQFFQRLLDLGYRVRIMGCEAQKWNLADHPNLERLQTGAMPPEDFLNTLHVFHYRGDPDWFEAFGRVNAEAMSCGVPVVAESRHGFGDYLKNGQGGFLYETTEQAIDLVESLRASPSLWQEQSELATKAIDRAMSKEAIETILDFYSR